MRLILLFALLLGLTACTVNPFTTENRFTGSATGAAVGATIGGGGAALLHATKPVIAISGLTGAGIGYYVTTLRFASGGLIQGGGQVFTLGDYVTIDIPSDYIFDTNSDELLPQAEPILDSVVKILCRYCYDNIIVSGNTSGFSTERWEQKLSQDRARQIASYLWAHGVDGYDANSFRKHKLTYVGYGHYFPIANDIRAESIRQNSHIQITAYPPRDRLIIKKKCQEFQNIGALEESTVAQAETH
ncbi:hypothetical protein AYO45_00305, partial [Gammaproteobacteria bacterium SCGC AG-212-F23]